MALSEITSESSGGIISTPTLRVIPSSIRKKKNITRPVEVLIQGERPNFVRPKLLVHLVLNSSISIEGFDSLWFLDSDGSRKSIIKFLFHKWLFSSLTKIETVFFFELPESTNDSMIFSALRARRLGFPLKMIRKALEKFGSFLFGKKPPSKETWIGYRSFRLSIERIERQVSQKHTPRYSGWKRHQNDHGSLGPPKEDPFYLEPLIENDNISIFLQIVKEINSGKSETIINDKRYRI